MTWFLGFMTLLLAVGFLYLSKQPKTYLVKRCIHINQSAEVIFEKICDLPSWNEWSPWLIHEPDAQLTYSDHPTEIGGTYQWQGEMIGSGTLTHVAFQAPQQIQQTIEFLKPFKSQAKITWDIRTTDSGCEICWSMQGQLPFVFRFLTAKMTTMIGKDYELGLAMLKGHLEENAAYPELSFDGEVELKEKLGLHRHFAGDLEAMQQEMGKRFQEMLQEVKEQQLEMDGTPATLYHESKPKGDPTWFEIDMFIPIKSAPSDKTAKRPGGKYYQVTLQGDYQFLGLAWHSAFANIQMHGYKFDWPRVPFETYENSPDEVKHSNELKTLLYIPIK